ncbi:RNA polymerase sigma factor [Arundinibacter roseus]|uniref:Sigma-70 family RNA polymerase sigma factor n=1 Tax=Arundinibacter roseus TaxID=2070510 RepID=A0A4R4KHB6_9BACT|nr:sigma-70 family RNA polymerase sigma factor [Arundinibacter roseus]TDB67490.1 sigma-70 family RNA polymerase sigma factor [Arundinibacter roseus]
MKDNLTKSEHVELWNSFRDGSMSAFSQLYDNFSDDLYRYGYNLVRNQQLVEDCLHGLFLHLHERKESLGSTDNIRFYLYKAMRRRLFDSVTHLNRFDSQECHFAQATFVVPPHESELIDCELRTQQNILLDAVLNNLPKRQRQILCLIYFKGLSYPQAAEVMNISMKSVYNTLNIAISTLRMQAKVTFERNGAFLC